ncbi:MAG: DUF5309 family protein [Muribaculaceae bacterium]|nr:DUF5309 family protein [Muribaculaceae bacterium]
MKKFLNILKTVTAVSDAVVIATKTVVDTVKAVVAGIKHLFTKEHLPMLVVMAAGIGAGIMLPADREGVAMVAVSVVAGVAGKGDHIVDSPLTTDVADTVSPGLLRNEIDDRIVKIRPMSTPLDQISRYGGARLCGSMKVDYYSVDTRPTQDRLKTAYDPGRTPAAGMVHLTVNTPAIFDASTTVMVPEVSSSTGGSLVLYVVSRDATGINVVAVNNFDTDSGEAFVPEIPASATLIRMGRAAAELDVMTPQFEALPKKDTNYCQIFKAQVEQSTFMKIANKEVGWSFSDQEEAAIIDMRLGMEKNFLFGHKAIITDPEKNEQILLTGGIWNQTDNTFEYDSMESEGTLIDLCKRAFTNNAGSSRKVLIGGTGLIGRLHRIEHSRFLSADQTTTKWGLDFTEIHSKFGTLYVLLSETFDQCGMPDGGMVIDPEYITKYSHVPFRTERLNLRQAGVRNTDAIVITEASCLVLRYPGSHLRIVHKTQS